MAQISEPKPQLTRPMLRWYDGHRRRLPWRAEPGADCIPYHVWLSEIMLQQTTVATVGPYFEAFIQRWPTVEELASAPLDDVLHAWQGLGYYARARNLHRCAAVVADAYGGAFPDREDELRKLPGIGPYTAAAVAAIAFDRRAVPVDGNVERVMARLYAIEAPLPAAKPRLAELARGHAPTRRAGDFAQALMDLGAAICTPSRPACPRCPLRKFCAAAAHGRPESFPARRSRPAKPKRTGVIFWAVAPGGHILLCRRPEKGLLGGMMEFPSTIWREGSWTMAAAKRHAPVRAVWRRLPGTVEHSFTQFDLELTVLTGACEKNSSKGGQWTRVRDFKDLALPTIMKKVARHALDQLG